MSIPALRRFRIIENRVVTPRLFTLVLEPADDQPMFSFLAGQWINLHLLNEDGSTWARAAFSIASAPSESHERIELAIKVYGDFTKRAQALAVGAVVGIQGPYGVFILPPKANRFVFFGGGIGVTPLRSMLREALRLKTAEEVHIFYTEKDRLSMIYEQEFRALAEEHPNFHPTLILTREAPSGWDGETVRLTHEMLTRRLSGPERGIYLMCGPEDFMQSVHEILVNEGVDVKTRLKKESFG